MNILIVLIPLSLLVLAVAIGFFFWAAGDGQFDDLDTPAHRILWDDDKSVGDDPQSRADD